MLEVEGREWERVRGEVEREMTWADWLVVREGMMVRREGGKG